MTETKQCQIISSGSKQYPDMGIGENVHFSPIIQAKEHPTSKKKAITAFCYHCFGGAEDELPDPGWRDAIRFCTSETCPLHHHRPYR